MHSILNHETNPLHAIAVRTSRPNLAHGQILVRVQKLILTSNTVTYAVAGRLPALNYFGHFPYPDKRLAACPAWGYGIVAESDCVDIPTGTRIKGCFTLAPWVVLTPSPVKRSTFKDTVFHRQKMPEIYATYQIQTKAIEESMENFMVSGGLLFSTGWGCAAQGSLAGADTMVLTSASSRTAIGAAFAAKHHAWYNTVIGVTSPRNVAFVRRQGLYDVVVTYDEINSLSCTPTMKVAVFDMAGSIRHKRALRQRFANAVVDYALVGMTNVDAESIAGQRQQVDSNGGASESGFFVTHAIDKAACQWGRKITNRMIMEAQNAFAQWSISSFESINVYGADEVLNVWNKTVNNEAECSITYVVSLWNDLFDSEQNMPMAEISKL